MRTFAGDFFGDGGPDISVFGPEFNASGQTDGLYDFASIDLSTKNSPSVTSRTVFIKNFGGPTTIPAGAPPAVKWAEAQADG